MTETAQNGSGFGAFLRRRRQAIVLTLVFALLAAFILWSLAVLKPTRWRSYTDDVSLRREAVDVTPRPAVWDACRAVPAPFNEPAEAQHVALSPDGSRMVFTKGLAGGNADLFMSTWNGRAWSEPEPLRALNSLFNEKDPSFSHDGQCLYFASDRPGGPGGWDIWVARWDGANYAWPLPLTAVVNSKFNETGPAAAWDGFRIYFASDRPRKDVGGEESKLPAKDLQALFPDRDFDLFYADRVPVGVTNVEIERAQGILYALRERALSDTNVMFKLGGTPESEAAVDRALAWLAAQQETNGCWSIKKSGGQDGHDVAATAFAMLAFYGRSERHDRPGRYRDNVEAGLRWLLREEVALTGDLRGKGGHNNSMYDHCIGTLALAEAYGLTKDPELYDPLQSAVFFLVDAQDPKSGGWRYQPRQEGDMSVSGWGIMAMKSAEFSGIHVQQKAFEGVRTWLKSVGNGPNGGQFSYQPGGGNASPAMHATGFFCSQLMGLSPNTKKALEAALSLVPKPERGKKAAVATADIYFLYYGTLAGYQYQGECWRNWRDMMHEKLLATQASEGSWDIKEGHGGSMGKVIVTSLAALSLEAHYRYTPLYGLGYEPPTNMAHAVESASLDELAEMPNYELCQRLLMDVNSPKDDLDPAVTPHGDFVYFASDRAGGAGGFDIYRSRITGRLLSAPRLLGPEINSEANEIGPETRMEGFDLFFSSDRGAQGRGLYRIHDSVTRQLRLRYDYARLPGAGFMWTHYGWRLTAILICLVGFVVLAGRKKKDGRSAD
jgi:hypothetical protein